MSGPQPIPLPEWSPLPYVVCRGGEGFVSVGRERFPFHAGESVRWPAGAMHRLWTEGAEMTTLMVEHPSAPSAR